MPDHRWDVCTRLARQIRRAQLRGWHLAKTRLLSDLRHAVNSLVQELTRVHSQISSATAPNFTPTIRDIYQDLRSLSEEFEELDFDLSTPHLSVTTEPIILEGVYLGPFEIRLRCDYRHGVPSYRVIARDGHPAESRENVTHPHVMDEVLCEGDGRHAIRQALAQGRLFDFFSLVASVLRTYNPESPYVELALWQGRSCSDCGAITDEDSNCQQCNSDICSDCETLCGGCEDGCCSECIDKCASCHEPYCQRCLTRCDQCQQRVCTACLPESEMCSNCYEEDDDDEDSAGDFTNKSDGVGQTPALT